MMRVLLVSFSVLPTLQNYMYLTADSLQKMKIEVHTLGVDNGTADLRRDKNHFFLPKVNTPIPSVKSIKQMNANIDGIIFLIEKIQPDVIHFVSKHTWNYFLINRLKKAHFSGKILHTFHDPVGHKGDRVRLGVILYNLLMGHRVDGIVVHSKRNVKITKRYLKPSAEVFFAPLGCSRWPDYENSGQEINKMLIFGRLNHYKGCEYIPQIAKEIEKLDADIRIVVAGKSSSDVDEKILQEISACRNVDFYEGFVPDEKIGDYFRDCDVVLVTHTSITQSGILLDAYRYAKPIVCFDIPGIREFLPDIVEPVQAFHCPAYAKEAVRILRDKELCRKMGLEEWMFGKQNFTNEHMTSHFFEIYKRVLI